MSRRVIWHGAVWYVHTSGWYQTEHPPANPEEATRWLANFGWRRTFWHGAVWYVHTSGWYQTENPATTRHKIIQCYHCRNTDPTWCCACPRGTGMGGH